MLYPHQDELVMIVAPPPTTSAFNQGASSHSPRDQGIGQGFGNNRPRGNPRQSTNAAITCGYCGHPDHAKRDYHTKTCEQCMITDLMSKLDKSKHQAHSTSHNDQSNGDSDHLEANMATLDLDQDPTWYIDSTASSHLIGDRSQLTNVV